MILYRQVSRSLIACTLLIGILSGWEGSRASATEPPDTFRIVGYLPEYRFQGFDPNHAKQLTDLILFAAEPTPAGDLELGKLEDAPWETLHTLQQDHQLRVILCMGGWGKSDHFSQAVRDEKSRERLVKSIVKTLLSYQLNGLDLDWESPQTPEEWDGFVKLLSQLNTAFAPHHLSLSITVAPWNELPVDAWKVVDRVQLMSYDYGQRHSTLAQAQADVQAFLDQGVPSGKLVLGVPFYGRDIEQRTSITYSKVVDRYRPESTVDEVDGYYFNGPETIRKKTRSALESSLGGVMIWEIGQDTTDEQSLLRVISQTVSDFTP